MGRQSGNDDQGVESTRKERLRTELLRRRRQLSEQDHRQASRAVCRRLISRDAVLDGEHLAGYVAFDGEVDVGPFIQHRLDAGTRISLPKVENDRRMDFIPVESLEALSEGAFGIPEPTGRPVDLGDVEVVLVPGVGFDPDGGRLGVGWGYYDRILTRRLDADGPSPFYVGVAHDCQLVDLVPTEAHDVDVHAVVTDTEWIDCTD